MEPLGVAVVIPALNEANAIGAIDAVVAELPRDMVREVDPILSAPGRHGHHG